jgi:hypothetical protein
VIVLQAFSYPFFSSSISLDLYLHLRHGELLGVQGAVSSSQVITSSG